MHQKQRRWGLQLFKIAAGIVIGFVIACYVFDQLVQFRMTDRELQTFFKRHALPAQIRYYNAGGRTIRYVSIGNDSLPALLFIHGAPSSLSVYTTYFKDTGLLKLFKLYAVDRPGYGYSHLGMPEPSLQKQAAMIRPILDSLNQVQHPVIVLGGSYGSSIACRLAMDYPKLVDGLVLVAPSLQPGAERTFWFTYLIEHPALNWFIPRMFQSANTEKVHHRQELEALLPFWKNIKVPVSYIQGEKDELIDTSNAGFARQQLTNVPYLNIQFLKGEPHFVPYVSRPLVRTEMINILQRAKALHRY